MNKNITQTDIWENNSIKKKKLKTSVQLENNHALQCLAKRKKKTLNRITLVET